MMKAGKLQKKLLALTLSVAMVLTSGMAVFAADTSAAAASAPKVQLNGEMVSFSDAVPQSVNNRVMVPFTAILEALGAKVSYDKATQTVSAVTSDAALEFQIGKADLKLTKDGKTETKTMDVVPFVDPTTNRTYVSTRFVAEAFGYTVGWDQKEKTVIIIDFDKMFANVDKDFSIICMEDGSGYDVNKAYKTTGSLNGSMTLNVPGASASDKTTPITVKFDADMSAVQQAMAIDMVLKMKLNLDDLIKIATAGSDVTEAQKAELQKTFDTLKNIEIEIKMDKDLMIYVKSPLFAQIGEMLGDKSITADTWVKVDAAAMYSSMGIDLKGLMEASMSGNVDLGEMLSGILRSASTSMDVDTYKQAQLIYSICQDIVGDKAFKTTGDTHTLTIDKASLTTVLTKYAKDLGLSASDLATLSKMDLSASIAITEKDGKASNVKLDVNFTMDELKAAIAMNGNGLNMTMDMSLGMGSDLNMNLKMTCKSVETTEKVNSSVPSDAKVVDLTKVLTNSTKEAK